MVREAIEDYGRHKSDLELNRKKCTLYKHKKPRTENWKNL
jgi:hypothetical protein